MDKNILYPLISVIVVIVVAAALYIAAGALGGTQHQPEGGIEIGVNASALFFGTTSKPLGMADYTYSYRETQEGGYWADVTISRKGNLSYVHKKDMISERTAYFEGEETILCIKYMDDEACAPVNDTSKFASYAKSLKDLLYSDDSTRALSEHYQKLEQYGGLDFGSGGQESSVGGHPCTEIKYVIDYSRLTVAQLNQIGMAANSPLVLRSSQYNFTMCIDPQTYDLYSKKVEFTDLGEPFWMESETTGISWGTGMAIEKPSNLSTEAALYNIYYTVNQVAQGYTNCLASGDSQECVAEVAVSWANPDLCSDTGEFKDLCLINAGREANRPGVCGQVSAGMKDVCYIEFASHMNDRSLCDNIVNATIKEQCLSLNITGTGECRADADCARAGCSSQLCVPAPTAADVVTTCEYLPEYACLAQTSCGCVEGRCGWRETPEYVNCMAQTG